MLYGGLTAGSPIVVAGRRRLAWHGLAGGFADIRTIATAFIGTAPVQVPVAQTG
jgi:hypothetical protein